MPLFVQADRLPGFLFGGSHRMCRSGGGGVRRRFEWLKLLEQNDPRTGARPATRPRPGFLISLLIITT